MSREAAARWEATGALEVTRIPGCAALSGVKHERGRVRGSDGLVHRDAVGREREGQHGPVVALAELRAIVVVGRHGVGDEGGDVERRVELRLALLSGTWIERERAHADEGRCLARSLARLAVAARAALGEDLAAVLDLLGGGMERFGRGRGMRGVAGRDR